MKILVDESVDGRIAERLRIAGHEVVSIAQVSAGCPEAMFSLGPMTPA